MFDVWIPFIGGLLLLLVGGELIVRGAVQVATRLGVSPLVIGLTLVGFGTSTPELVTSVDAALAGVPGIAFGNIVGSNIANILLIVGAAAVIGPVSIAPRSLRRDGVVMLVVAVAFTVAAFVGPLGRLVGVAFILALAAYVFFAFRQEQATESGPAGAASEGDIAAKVEDTLPAATISLPVAIATAVVGLLLVVFGGGLLVEGAVSFARSFGISETVIGLTIVAVGTSLPEMVTSIVAGLRGQGDVAFGNIVGSNIYNILFIGGTTALIAPGAVPAEIVAFDNLVMLGVSLLLFAVAWTSHRIVRWEGALLLAGYALYIYAIWPH